MNFNGKSKDFDGGPGYLDEAQQSVQLRAMRREDSGVTSIRLSCSYVLPLFHTYSIFQACCFVCTREHVFRSLAQSRDRRLLLYFEKVLDTACEFSLLLGIPCQSIECFYGIRLIAEKEILFNHLTAISSLKSKRQLSSISMFLFTSVP